MGQKRGQSRLWGTEDCQELLGYKSEQMHGQVLSRVKESTHDSMPLKAEDTYHSIGYGRPSVVGTEYSHEGGG
jgi:hypothetical protein